jgi:hypothetical protein
LVVDFDCFVVLKRFVVFDKLKKSGLSSLVVMFLLLKDFCVNVTD